MPWVDTDASRLTFVELLEHGRDHLEHLAQGLLSRYIGGHLVGVVVAGAQGGNVK